MAQAQPPHHDYHLVDPSPWPAVGAVSALVLAVGLITWMHHVVTFAPMIFAAGALGVAYTMIGWWRDVIREAEHQHREPENAGIEQFLTAAMEELGQSAGEQRHQTGAEGTDGHPARDPEPAAGHAAIFGDPTKATAEAGKAFVDAAVEGLVETFKNLQGSYQERR